MLPAVDVALEEQLRAIADSRTSLGLAAEGVVLATGMRVASSEAGRDKVAPDIKRILHGLPDRGRKR
jgi:hypothetical protein